MRGGLEVRRLSKETAEEIIVEGGKFAHLLIGNVLLHLDEDHRGGDLLGHAAKGLSGLAQTLEPLFLGQGGRWAEQTARRHRDQQNEKRDETLGFAVH